MKDPLDLEFAEYKYRHLIREDFDNEYLHYNLAATYFQQGKYEEAEIEYILATLIKPEFFEAYNNLAVLYCKQGRYKEAILECEKALAVEFENKLIHRVLAVAYKGAGYEEQALVHFAYSETGKPSEVE